MRKRWALLSMSAVVLLALPLLTACGGSKITLEEGKINVVTSFFPLYDFASKIGGGHVHVVNAVPAGVEPHDWTPKSRDISTMSKADLFIYQGAGFEGWVHDFEDSLKEDAMVRMIEASQGVDLIRLTEEEKEEHEQEDGEGHGHKDESDFDPHAWLSPRNAKVMAENILNGLIEADSAHKPDYEANFKKLSEELDRLHLDFKEQLGKASRKEIVVSHQAFAYLARDYGLMQKAIMGLAPDSEPTAQDIKDTIDFVRSNGVKVIFFEELVSDKLAKTLAKDAGVETLVLNPLEGLTDEQLEAGEDYVSVMRGNLQNLVKALQ